MCFNSHPHWEPPDNISAMAHFLHILQIGCHKNKESNSGKVNFKPVSSWRKTRQLLAVDPLAGYFPLHDFILIKNPNIRNLTHSPHICRLRHFISDGRAQQSFMRNFHFVVYFKRLTTCPWLFSEYCKIYFSNNVYCDYSRIAYTFL